MNKLFWNGGGTAIKQGSVHGRNLETVGMVSGQRSGAERGMKLDEDFFVLLLSISFSLLSAVLVSLFYYI